MSKFQKACISLVFFAIILLLIVLPKSKQVNQEYLRLHIRANSNQTIDQNIKYKVKEVVVDYLTPFVAKCKTKADAKDMLESQKKSLNRVIDDFLIANGFDYGSKVSILSEKFPTRVYDGVELPSGIYDAVIIELGKGVGDNWWCVVYPPLCFSDSKNVVYRSLILDVINEFKKGVK